MKYLKKKYSINFDRTMAKSYDRNDNTQKMLFNIYCHLKLFDYLE